MCSSDLRNEHFFYKFDRMKNVNLLDHIANLFVVILGISIAFYLEGYREEKANKKQERKYIESLTKDLETDLQAFDTLTKTNGRIADYLVKLSSASVGAPYKKDSLLYYLFGTQYNPPFASQRTSYESMKSSGKIELISNFELRNNIVELYEQYYRGVDQYDASIDRNIRDFYAPFYVKNIVFTGPFSVDHSFLKKSEFRNIIFGYRYLFVAKTDYYQKVSMQLKEVLSMLGEYEDSLK